MYMCWMCNGYSFSVDETEEQGDEDSVEFAVQDGYISYGSAVKLVCCSTGLSLPKLVCSLCTYLFVCVGTPKY